MLINLLIWFQHILAASIPSLQISRITFTPPNEAGGGIISFSFSHMQIGQLSRHPSGGIARARNSFSASLLHTPAEYTKLIQRDKPGEGYSSPHCKLGTARQLLLPMHMKSLEHSNSNSILSAPSAKSWSHAGFKLPEWLKFTNKSCSAYSLDCSLKVEVRNLEHLFFMYRSQKCLIQLPVKALGEHPVAWNGTGISTFWTAIPQVMKCEVQRSRQQNNPVYQKQRHM